MEKIKPKVIGYKQIGFNGNVFYTSPIWNNDSLISISKRDFKISGFKSKFRPVYAK